MSLMNDEPNALPESQAGFKSIGMGFGHIEQQSNAAGERILR